MGGCCVMDNPVGDFFRNIGDSLGIGSSGGCGYTPNRNITADNSTKIANELAEKKKNAKERSEKIEKKLIDTLLAYNDELIKEIRLINQKQYGSVKLNLNVDQISKKSEELKKNVVGYASSILNDRLVLTDPELSVILKIEDDKERGKKFNTFCDSIVKQANDGLCMQVKRTVEQQSKMIREEIMSRIAQLEKNQTNLKNELIQIQSEKKRNDTVSAPQVIDRMYKYELSCILLDELN